MVTVRARRTYGRERQRLLLCRSLDEDVVLVFWPTGRSRAGENGDDPVVARDADPVLGACEPELSLA